MAATHAVFSVSLPGQARACSLIEHEEQETNYYDEVYDRTPPGMPALHDIQVSREPESSGYDGCLGASTCAGMGAIGDSNGYLWIHFDDHDQDIDITLSVRARDLGGNLGEPVMVDVSSYGSGGCSAGGSAGSTSLALVILALAVAVRRGAFRE